MAKTAKYYGVNYIVKPTGRIITTKAKSYYDFNGYWTEKEATSRQQFGLYHPDTNELFATLGQHNTETTSHVYNVPMFSGGGKSFGSVTIREEEEND